LMLPIILQTSDRLALAVQEGVDARWPGCHQDPQRL
jgi:hypothetical protein